jgi:hypothetical protein
MKSVAVFVQTCPARRGLIGPTLASLRTSDARTIFEVLEHPDGQERCRFYRSVLAAMADCGAGHVIRCEDDVIVNRHLVHNYLSWPALREPLFGCGWLYVSEAAYRDHVTTRTTARGERYRATELMYGSLCVAMPVAHALRCLVMFDELVELYGCPLQSCTRTNRRCEHRNHRPRQRHSYGQDTLFSRTMWRMGRRVFFPQPVLAENRLIPSTRGLSITGDLVHWRAGPLFAANWRRGELWLERPRVNQQPKPKPRTPVFARRRR